MHAQRVTQMLSSLGPVLGGLLQAAPRVRGCKRFEQTISYLT